MRLSRRLLSTITATVMLIGLMGVTSAQDDMATEAFQASLEPMNTDLSGEEPYGEVLITRSGETITLQVHINGVPPNMAHWQHIHGFADGSQPAACPTSDADSNDDGVIDLIETEAAAGTTMIPLNDDPISFDIPADTYPEAGSDGGYNYEVTVKEEELEAAFDEKFPDAGGLDLENRVVFIHGVPEDTEIPDSVQSLGDIPAAVTLPIACGDLEPVEDGTPIASPAASPES